MYDQKIIAALAPVLAQGRPLIVGEIRGLRKERKQGKAKASGKDYDMKNFIYTVEIGDLANLRSVPVKVRIPDDVPYEDAKPLEGLKKGAVGAFYVTGLDSGSRDGAVWEASGGIIL